MRCTSAVVLSALAVGQVAAAHNRHASFHARREAAKRDNSQTPGGPVDWHKIVYDLKDVKWHEVFGEKPANPVPPKEAPNPVYPVNAPQPQPDPVPVKPVVPVPKEPAQVPKPKVPENTGPTIPKTPQEQNSPLNTVVEAANDLMANVAQIGSIIDAKIGINDKSNNGGIWIGKDGEWGMEVTNTGEEDAVYYCWNKNGFSGMTINVNAPAISVGIKKGKTVSISVAPGVSGACAPATPSTPKSDFGGVKNTWAEFTMGDGTRKMGVFNVSKNVNMKGCSLSMQGTTCLSNNNQCVFRCQDPSVDSCVTGYELHNCDASNGGGQGYDPVMGGVGGGCNMATNGERIKVSFA